MAGKPSVGLALGGGFLRGTANIGVLRVLKEEGIPVHMVAGSSAGSIVAALCASGYSPERMEKIAVKLHFRDIFDYGSTLVNLLLIAGEFLAGFLHLPFPMRRPLGLMKGNKLEALVNKWVGRNRLFDDTEIPLGITAVDARDGALVVFLSGKPLLRTVLPPEDVIIRGEPVARAVRASAAVPGLFEPVRLGERLLVDGGVRDNVPAYVLRRMGAEFVIAVDVGYDGREMRCPDNIIGVLSQSLDIIASEGINLKLEEHADVVIRPVIRNMGPWDFDKIKYCIRQGEQAAAAAVDGIKRQLNGGR